MIFQSFSFTLYIQTFCASPNSFHLRADCSLYNTTLKPLRTKIQSYTVLIHSTCNQIKTFFLFFFIFTVLWTRLSFSVCSSSLFRPGNHCCPAKNHNNKHLLWFNFTVESLWGFEICFCAIHPLDLYRSEAEFVVVYVKIVTRDHSNAIF